MCFVNERMAEAGTSIDTETLESYLASELDVRVTATEQVHDGLNPSLAISTVEEGSTYILRRPNKLRHTASFNDLRAEYRVLERLEETGIPTPEPVLLCEDTSIIGDPFLVMTYLDGENVPLGSPHPNLDGLPVPQRAKLLECAKTSARFRLVVFSPGKLVISSSLPQ